MYLRPKRQGLLVLISVLVPSIVTVGCVSQQPLVQGYSGPQQPAAAVADRFTYQHSPVSNNTSAFRRRPQYTVREITFSLNAENSVGSELMRLEYYDLVGSEKTPVIVLLPVLNKWLIVSRYFARYFANQGYAAVVVDRAVSMQEYLDHPETMIRQSVLEYRRVLDWVEQNPEHDLDNVGLLGISLGGINAVLVSALDERVDAVVAIMAGGDLPYIFENSSDRRVIRAGSNIMQRNGLSRDEFASYLRQTIETDPLDVAPYIDARRVLMVLARSDTIVPFEKQEELRTRMGGPEALYLPTGHRTSAVFLPLLRRSAHRFFIRQFESS